MKHLLLLLIPLDIFLGVSAIRAEARFFAGYDTWWSDGAFITALSVTTVIMLVIPLGILNHLTRTDNAPP